MKLNFFSDSKIVHEMEIQYLQWLERLWDHENLFKTGVV